MDVWEARARVLATLYTAKTRDTDTPLMVMRFSLDQCKEILDPASKKPVPVVISNGYKVNDLFRQLVAIRVNFHWGDPHVTSLVTPYKIAEDGRVWFYWDQGPSQAAATFVDRPGDTELDHGEAVIVHVYGPEPEDCYDWDAIDQHREDLAQAIKEGTYERDSSV